MVLLGPCVLVAAVIAYVEQNLSGEPSHVLTEKLLPVRGAQPNHTGSGLGRPRTWGEGEGYTSFGRKLVLAFLAKVYGSRTAVPRAG